MTRYTTQHIRLENGKTRTYTIPFGSLGYGLGDVWRDQWTQSRIVGIELSQTEMRPSDYNPA